MSTNPYQSPQAENATPKAHSPQRKDALKRVRVATFLLTVPGVFNVFCFFAYADPMFRNGGPLSLEDLLMLAGCFLETVLVVLACWFLLLPLVEFIGRRIQSFVAPTSDRELWDDTLYRSLRPMPLLAFFGMLLWLAWVVAFYYLKLNFYVISYAVGIPAHILAACLYVPLLYRWVKLWRSPRPTADAEAG